MLTNLEEISSQSKVPHRSNTEYYPHDPNDRCATEFGKSKHLLVSQTSKVIIFEQLKS